VNSESFKRLIDFYWDHIKNCQTCSRSKQLRCQVARKVRARIDLQHERDARKREQRGIACLTTLVMSLFVITAVSGLTQTAVHSFQPMMARPGCIWSVLRSGATLRTTHIIRPNANCETPSRALFVELLKTPRSKSRRVEERFIQKGLALHVVRGADGHRWSETAYWFTSKAQFWQIIDGIAYAKTQTYILIDDSDHTLALLDVFTMGYERGFIWSKVVIECPPTIVQGRSTAGSICFLEKRNIWQQPSTSYSDGANIKSDCESSSNSNVGSPERTLEHAAQTTKLLWLDWWGFLKRNDLGGFSPTIGSQSVRSYRHRWMTGSILVDNNKAALKLSRDAYKGGRCECFFIGRLSGEFYLVDVNSMYGAVMRDLAVPVRLSAYTEHADKADLRSWAGRGCVIADLTLRTAEPVYAVKDGEKLLLPAGRFRVALASEEVKHAIEHAEIDTVHRVAVYETAPAFREYVDAMYALKTTATDSGDEISADKWKMLLRAFYGKWGQHGGVWEKIEDVSTAEIKKWMDVDLPTKTITEYRQFGGIVQQLSNEPESFESCPAIAAAITANARMRLWELILLAGRENVFYVDTDSLLVNAMGFHALSTLVDARRLGALRLQGVFGRIDIRGPKDYTLDNRVRRKGVTRGSLQTEVGAFVCEQRRSVQAMIEDGDMSHAITRRVRYSTAGVYDKGVVWPDGHVTPIIKE
jgi:hypothetical protein